MITGYNTDVRHNDVVYHVQTEDKGLSNPCIESLLYVGGQILANKRTSYAELLADKGERAVAALMDHQHRTMIAAIRAGKFDKKLAAMRAVVPASGDGRRLAADETVPSDSGIEVLPTSGSFEAGPLAGERTLDQVILDYLTTESEQDQLVLAIDGEEAIGAGRRVRLTAKASSSRSGQPLPGVRVVAKLISTIAGPQTLADGESDALGTVELELEIPSFDRGSAALIVTAASGLGRTEYKHLL
jgi:hypothetical protein